LGPWKDEFLDLKCWVHVLRLQQAGCVTLGKFLNIPEPWLLHMCKVGGNSCLRGLYGD
jgi:hypothetical protein